MAEDPTEKNQKRNEENSPLGIFREELFKKKRRNSNEEGSIKEDDGEMKIKTLKEIQAIPS